MKKLFLCSTEILGADQVKIPVHCKLLTGEIGLLSGPDEANLENFLQRLFEIVVKDQGDKCGFEIVGEPSSSFDDLEREVFEEKTALLRIVPINACNFETSFSDENTITDEDDVEIPLSEDIDLWNFPWVICDRIEFSFAAHIKILCALEGALAKAAPERRIEVFEETREELRDACADFIEENEDFDDDMVRLWIKMSSSVDDFDNSITAITC